MSNPITNQILAAGVQKIINDYGAAIEFRKSTFADVSELPYPKPVIKAAMIAAVQIVQDEKAREVLKTNFVLLADWQEGIGPGIYGDFENSHYGDSRTARRTEIARLVVRLKSQTTLIPSGEGSGRLPCWTVCRSLKPNWSICAPQLG